MKGVNSSNYIDGGRRGTTKSKPLLGLLDSQVPSSEARALLPLVRSSTLTVEQARELITFPARARRVLLDIGVHPCVVWKAAEFRARVLAKFDALYLAESDRVARKPCNTKSLVPFSRRRRPDVKILDRLRQRPQEPAHPEDGPGKSAADVIGETGGICVECFRRVAVRALDDRALCAYCYKVEVNAQAC